MIIATAGHIDHGKTSLVAALTGVDSDRLPEEKQRGMSIDLGFAYATLGGERTVGLVDVPGHERFIRNMLAGVTAVDCALLVVAADDGPMPQTREHLDILDLLGVERGVVALTKIDRVDAERIEQVRGEIHSLLATTTLRNAPVVAVCAPTHQGIDELAVTLLAQGARDQDDTGTYNFRLAVDRSFTLTGAGLVVTGHVFSGSVAVDDRVIITPGGGEFRVRGIHANDAAAARGHAGERCALNLAGGRRETVRRGDWVVAEPAHAPTRRLDARIRVVAGEKRPLKHWTPVHLHLGTQDLSARVATLDSEAIEPGQEGLVRLVLDRDAAAWVGDRFIVRDQSAQRTLAGGQVLDAQPPVKGRSRNIRLAYLKGIDEQAPEQALMALVEGTPAGLDLNLFARAWNLTPTALERLATTEGLEVLGTGEARLAMAAGHWEDLSAATLKAVGAWHEEHPERAGIERERLRRAVPQRISPQVLDTVIQGLRGRNALEIRGHLVGLPGHRAQLPDADRLLWEFVRPHLSTRTDKPPTLPDLAKVLELDVDALRQMAERAVGAGLLAHVAGNRFFTLPRLRELAQAAETLAQRSGDEGFSAAAFRDISGIGRNVSIELLEYFDRIGLTRRLGNVRKLRRPAAAVIAEYWSE